MVIEAFLGIQLRVETVDFLVQLGNLLAQLSALAFGRVCVWPERALLRRQKAIARPGSPSPLAEFIRQG